MINEYILYPDSLAKNAIAFLLFPFLALTVGSLPVTGAALQLQKIGARCREKRSAVFPVAPYASDPVTPA